MRRLLGLLCVVPAFAVVLWILFGGEPEMPAPQEQPQTPVAEVQAAAPAESVSLAAEPKAGRIEAAPERAGVAAPLPAPALPQLAELRGRLLLEGGAPARGARVALNGWAGNNERVLKHGEPKDWKSLSVESDADGRFALRFDPPRAYQFVLETTYSGCVSAKWRWAEIEPAATLDLGQVTLPLGGAITGRVVDAQGNPTRDAWMVYAEGAAVASGAGSDASRGMAQADGKTGEFRIENMPPGAVELKAHSEIANWIEGPTAEVRAGETVEADIRYTGPDNSSRITIVTFSRPFYVFSHDISGIVLGAPGQKSRTAHRIANSSQSFSFDELAPGSYSVTIDDPRFKPWRKDGVTPGQRVSATLEGASSVRLAVLDEATGAAVEHYALRVRFEHVDFSPSQFELFGANAERPSGGLVEGLVPLEQTLIVLADGYAPCELQLADLLPGEVRPLRAELRRGPTVVARVLQADGRTPVAGLTVTLTPSTPERGEPRGALGPAERASQREATSAANGRASFTAVAAGTYSLRAELTPLLCAELEQIEIGSAEIRKPFELVLPPSGWLVGRVIGFEEAPLAGCALVVLPADASPEERALSESRSSTPGKVLLNPIAPDGSFRAGPLRIGQSSVRLQYPAVTVRYGQSSLSSMPGSTIELGQVEISPGGELRRDFDLQGRTPGWIAADVRVQGVAAALARVFIQSADEEQRNGAIQLDSQGQGTSGPIAPGPVRFQITAADGKWSWSPPGTWNIVSGETLRVSWDIPLVYGSLQLVDDLSGVALAGREVLVRRDSSGSFEYFEVTADAQGRLQLHLVPAAYLVEFLIEIGRDGRRERSPYEAARFDWNANSPGNSVLRVRRRR
jgi:hypothetical protein